MFLTWHKNQKIVFVLILFIGVFLNLCLNTKCLSILQGPPRMNYRIDIVYIKRCEDAGTNEIEFDLHLRRKSRSEKILNGNIINKIQLDNHINGRQVFDIWGNGGWKNNFFLHNSTGFCDKAKLEVGECWTKFLSSCGISPPECPVLPGNHTCDNININYFRTCLKVQMVIGKYRVQHSLFKKNEKKGCFEIMLEIKEGTSQSG